MSTRTRPELSMKNPYHIERHRYYELKHFCLQYKCWKEKYRLLNGFNRSLLSTAKDKDGLKLSPTEQCAERKMFYQEKIDLIEKAAKQVDPILWRYIVAGVTEPLSYEQLKIKYKIPCGKDLYYKVYRKFFYILNNARK